MSNFMNGSQQGQCIYSIIIYIVVNEMIAEYLTGAEESDYVSDHFLLISIRVRAT